MKPGLRPSPPPSALQYPSTGSQATGAPPRRLHMLGQAVTNSCGTTEGHSSFLDLLVLDSLLVLRRTGFLGPLNSIDTKKTGMNICN